MKVMSISLLQALQLQLHLLAQLEVQRAQRLVQKQHLRLVDQAAGDGHALLLAAGHLADAAAFEALQAHDLQHIPHLAADGLFVHLLAGGRPKATFSKTFRWGNSAYF